MVNMAGKKISHCHTCGQHNRVGVIGSTTDSESVGPGSIPGSDTTPLWCNG